MDIYQLEYILHEPTEDQGGMCWAEIPAIQGCAALHASSAIPP